jgi:hypothetical protein
MCVCVCVCIFDLLMSCFNPRLPFYQQINLPKPFEEHFLPLMFRVSSRANPQGKDLLPELYKSGASLPV